MPENEDAPISLVYLVRRGQGYAAVNLPMPGGVLSVDPGRPFQAAPRVAKSLLKKFPNQVVRISYTFEDDPATAAVETKAKGE